MADKWSVWQSDLERLGPFAEEWAEGRVEEFIRTLLNSVARKRQQRDALLAMMDEVRALHATYRKSLAFFDLDRACQSWSVENCDASDVERVLLALAEWRTQMQEYGNRFPPPDNATLTLAAVQACVLDAQAAASAILPCFGVLDKALSPGAAQDEETDAAATSAQAGSDEPGPSAEPSDGLPPLAVEAVAAPVAEDAAPG
jgi:hypothetical protein